MLTNGLLSAGRSVLPRSRSARHLEHWLYHQPSVTELRFRNVRYGSGFLDGDGPDHLPGHTTFDVSFGKGFGENWWHCKLWIWPTDDSCWTAPTHSAARTSPGRPTLRRGTLSLSLL